MEAQAHKPSQTQSLPRPVELLVRLVESNPVYHPVYTVSLRHAERLRELEEPHDQVGGMLTVAYNYQLAVAAYVAGRPVATPLVFRVARGSLPRPEWVRDAVAEALVDTVIWAADSLRRGELSMPGLGHVPETIVVLHRNKEDVERALAFAESVEARLAKIGSQVTRQRLPGPRRFSGDIVGRFYVLASEYQLRGYREALEMLRGMGMEPESRGGAGGLEIYVAERRIGRVVVTVVVYTNNRASIFVMVDDRIRAIPMGDGVYDNLEIRRLGGEPPTVYSVTVQQTGNRLFLNLTRALKMLGLGRGDTVRVRVEPEKRRIIIEPAVEVV